VHWKKTTLVGVGLLGGSLGLALRKRRLAGSVAGFVRRASSVVECKRVGAVDVATRDLEEAVSGADLIVLCTPIAQMEPLARQMCPFLAPGAVVTDVGSVKGTVVRNLEGLIAEAGGSFVGSHPMAGSEKTGVASAKADLFERAVCVVTPTPKSNRAAVRSVERLWKSAGARLLRLSPETHDLLVSRSSHLPHVLAASLANFVLSPKHPKEQALLCANGFRDTTRIASGSPEMWRDIAMANGANLADVLGILVKDLQGFQRVLRNGNPEEIAGFFEQAKQRRDVWSRRVETRSPE
jgi:prephenate dehydrogenase